MASKTLGVNSGFVPVRTAVFADYSTPQRAALRQYNEDLMTEAKSQELPAVPPTADQAIFQAELDETDKRLEKLEYLIKSESEDDAERLRAELDETDKRLEQLERELNKLIKSESEDDAERLRADLKECRNKKLGLERELRKRQNLHSETDRRLRRLEEAFMNFVQSDSVDDAKRLSADLRECMQKRNELEQQLRQCRNLGAMDFLSPEESDEFERDRRQAFEQADFEPVSEPDLSNAPEAVYDSVLLEKYENSEKQLKLCKLQEVLLVAQNKQLTSKVEKQGKQINFYVKALKKNRKQAERNTPLTNQIAASKNAELARRAADIADLRSKIANLEVANRTSEAARMALQDSLEVLQETNTRQQQNIAQWTSSSAGLRSANSVLEQANSDYKTKENKLNEKLRAFQATSTECELTQGKLIRQQNDLEHCEQEKEKLIEDKERIKLKLQSQARVIRDLKEERFLESQDRELNLPVAREIPEEYPQDFYQNDNLLETSRADAVRDYILARVKWWVLEEAETGRIVEISRIFKRFADVPELFPSDENVLSRYRVELVRLLKNKWEEVTNEEWAEEDTGVWGTLAGYVYAPDPIPTIRKILEEFEKIGVNNLFDSIKDERIRRSGSRRRRQRQQNGGESKSASQPSRSQSSGGEVQFTLPTRRPEDLTGYDSSNPSEIDDGFEFAGGQTNDVDKRSRDAFAQSGGGIDLSAIDERTSRRKTRPRRGRAPPDFQNMSKSELQDNLRQFELNERYGTLLNNEADMRDALRGLLRQGKVNKKGKKIALQPVLRF